jgi:autotransporter passenger strand-loop-strand repeat protein
MITVSSGQTHTISSGVTDTGDVVLAGGTLVVGSAGTAISTTDFGVVDVDAGGLTSDSIVASGGVETVSGFAFFGFPADAIGTTINNGGVQQVLADGNASNTVVNNGGLQYVSGLPGPFPVGAEAFVEDTLITNGGIQEVLDFSIASGTTVNSGGLQFVSGTFTSALPVRVGGTASDTVINGGGIEEILDFGAAIGTIVNSGGYELLNGGIASATIVNVGAADLIWSSGIARDTQVLGGLEVVEGPATGLIAGSVFDTTVIGGDQIVFGSAAGTTVISGFQVVWSGGVANGTVVNGKGSFELVVGGSAFNDFVFSGGTELVSAGGIASGSQVGVGGVQFVQNGAQAFADAIDGGLVDVQAGGLAFVNFTSNGGILQLDASQIFSGTIGGFASPAGVNEAIDLRDIAFTSATTANFTEAANNSSGTLTVTDGTHTATLTLLGQYSTANFTLSSDGHGGTLITDPAGSASSTVLHAHG